MKKILLFILLTSVMLSSCLAPVNLSFERAATLGKNKLEVNGAYSHYSKMDNEQYPVVNNNYGGRIGIGLSDKTDLKIRYEHLFGAGDNTSEANYLSIAPKTQIIKNTLSLIVPVSCYFGDTIFDDGSRYSIAPELISTHTMSKNVDLSIGAKGDYFFRSGDDQDEFFIGLKIGMGLSSNIDRWAIRPEWGILFSTGQSSDFWSYGFALNIYLDPFTKKQK